MIKIIKTLLISYYSFPDSHLFYYLCTREITWRGARVVEEALLESV